MLTFLDFVLLIILVIVSLIALILLTGIVYNQKGYVSIINRAGKFFKIEDNRYAYYLPILYRKVAYYPIEPKKYKINHQEVMVYVKDPMLLYKNKINLKKLFRQNKNLEANLKKYKIIVKQN